MFALDHRAVGRDVGIRAGLLRGQDALHVAVLEKVRQDVLLAACRHGGLRHVRLAEARHEVWVAILELLGGELAARLQERKSERISESEREEAGSKASIPRGGQSAGWWFGSCSRRTSRS